VALAGCEAPADAAFEPSAAARSAPPPQLAETAGFDAALERAGPDAAEMEAASAALAARAAALRERAEALSAPVIAPDARGRLTGG
jgi:hypothetical protein